MTPQEKELIQSVATKLKQSPPVKKDIEAEKLISDEIGAQPDVIYKLTQAVLVQEMALKQLKEKNDYLEKNAEYYKNESSRSPISKMFGGSRQAPEPPQPPVRQPSAFGGFMQTAAGVAAGMVAGSLISDMLFNDDKPADTAAADPAPEATTDPAADNNTQDTAANDQNTDNVDTAAVDPTENDSSSFLDDSSNSFASDYTGGFGDAGFGDSGFGDGGFGDTGFGDAGFGGDDAFANNGFGDNGFDDFGDDDSGFGDDDV